MGQQMKEKESMKKQCREIISIFGEKRRNSQLKKQGLPIVNNKEIDGKDSRANEIDFLLREAEKMLSEKN